jgi:ubiquinone/menaquinone biosynthesis C-methylase UbiE
MWKIPRSLLRGVSIVVSDIFDCMGQIMGFSDYFSRQAQNPFGLFGRLVMSRVFDYGNTMLNDMVKEILSVRPNDYILEIGFGTGKLMSELAPALNQGQFHGVDTSDAMVSMARKTNKKALARGRVKIWHGSFEQMECSHNTYDTVISVNTIYFWKKPEITMDKIFQVLKPGGRLILGFEDKDQMESKPVNKDVFRIYSTDEVKNMLASAGFSGETDIVSKTRNQMIFNCVVAIK